MNPPLRIRFLRGERRWGGLALVLLRGQAVKIRPEFLEHQSDRIQRNLRSPNAGSIRQGSIGRNEQMWIVARPDESAFGMVAEGGDGRGKRAAANFRAVELLMPVVALGHNNSADGITGATKKLAVTRLVKARILMQHHGKNCADHEVLYGAVGRRGSVTLGVSEPSLAVSRFSVIRLVDRGNDAPPRILHAIKRAQCNHFKLLLCGHRR